MSELGLVERDDHDKESDTQSGKEAASKEIAYVLCTSLETTTKTEDNGTDHDGYPPTKVVTARSTHTSTKERASGEHADYQA